MRASSVISPTVVCTFWTLTIHNLFLMLTKNIKDVCRGEELLRKKANIAQTCDELRILALTIMIVVGLIT